MNAKEALEALKSGKKLRSIYDSTDIFYLSYHQEKIGRVRGDCGCAASIIHLWNEPDFLKSHDTIEFKEVA